MFPILYESTETDFDSNGICRLTDCLSCTVTEERNGIYECDFEYPVSGAYYDQIYPGRIIACVHDDNGDIQPFDIVSYSRPISGVVAFHAVHVSYRLAKKTIYDMDTFSSQASSGLSGMIQLLEDYAYPTDGLFSFTYETDIDSSSTYPVTTDTLYPRTARALLGGEEGSLIDVYGGELEFDKFSVKLHEERGSTKDFIIRYGLNLSDFTEETDYEGTYATVAPYWKGEDTIVSPGVVDTGLTDYAGRASCVPLDLTDKFDEQPSTSSLTSAAESYISANSPTLPSQNISIDFVRLQDEDENLSDLLRCTLCDSVQVVFPMYNMTDTFKIVKTVWNVLLGRYDSMELGNLQTSLAEAVGAS